jgi:cardiolipin synthase
VNLPNILTLSRILLIPVFAIVFINGRHLEALFIFALAALTDSLDGFLARYTHQQTAIGTFMDPLADKTLLLTAFVLLGFYHEAPLWCLVMVLSREVLILTGWMVRYLLTRSTAVVPSVLGKATTVFQVALVVALLLKRHLTVSDVVTNGLLYTAMAATAASGIHYIYHGLKELEPRKV